MAKLTEGKLRNSRDNSALSRREVEGDRGCSQILPATPVS